MCCVTTPEDAEDKSSNRITLIRGVGAVVSYLKAVFCVHRQFCFWPHISGCVWHLSPTGTRSPMWMFGTHTTKLSLPCCKQASQWQLLKNLATLMFYLIVALSHPGNGIPITLSMMNRNSRVVQDQHVSVLFYCQSAARRRALSSESQSLHYFSLSVRLICCKSVISLGG